MNTLLRTLLTGGLLVALLSGGVSSVQAAPAAPPCYVNDDVLGGNSGTSWANAYTDLQSALGATACTEIWVAAGWYTPGTGRTVSFALHSGVAVYGGFAGTETDLSQRDWQAHPTILSGEIGTADPADNTYHVISASEVQGAVLDGLTITGGYAGIGSPVDRGGGMHTYQSAVTVRNSIFQGNYAVGGGGIFSHGGVLILEGVDFIANRAAYNGGGLHTYIGTQATLTGVTFVNNQALGNYPNGLGGGIVNWGSSTVLANVLFRGNTAGLWGGGLSNYSTSTVSLTNATFYANLASGEGAGGLDNDTGATATVSNNLFWENSGSQVYNAGDSLTISYSLIQGGCQGDATCNNLIPGNPDPLFVDAAGGNLRLQAGSPAIDAGNNTAPGLAGITTDLDGRPRFFENPGAANSGAGSSPIVDMGAYETGFVLYLPMARR